MKTLSTIVLALATTAITATAQEIKERRPLVEEFLSPPTQVDSMFADTLKKCGDSVERTLFYDPITGVIENVTEYSNSIRTFIDFEKRDAFVENAEHLIDAHNHLISPFIYMRGGQKKRIVKKMNYILDNEPELLNQRLVYQMIPSITDIKMMTWIDASMYLKNRFAEHRIVLIEEGLPPRVILYGLSPEVQEDFQDIITEHRARIDEYNLNGTEKQKMLMIEAYEDVLDAQEIIVSKYKNISEHIKYHYSKPWRKKEGREPTLLKLFQEINNSEYFFVRDKGYIEVKKKLAYNFFSITPELYQKSVFSI